MIRSLALVSILFASSSAHADPQDPAAIEASGSKHFELAEYAAAIADFKEAFRITDRPELLFNIAQAYRLAGDCLQARTFYKNYLRRVPDAQNADKVRARIDELEACATKAAATPPPAAPPTESPAAPAGAPIAAPPPATRTWKTTAGLATLGGGVIGVGIGVLFAAKGASKSDQLREACATDCTPETARELDDAGRAANRNSTIGFIAGGALLATGAVLVILDRGSKRESGPSVAVGASGATASWSWRF